MKNLKFNLFSSLTLLTLLATPSFAGQWTILCKGEGAHSRGYGGATPLSVPWEEEDAVMDLPLAFHGSSNSQINPGETIMNSLKGQLSADAIWIPSGPNDVPPAFANFLVYSYVIVNTTNSSFGSFKLENGFNSPITSNQDTWNSLPYYHKTMAGYKLITVDMSTALEDDSGNLLIELPSTNIDVEVTGTNSAPIGSSHIERAGVNATYTVVIDNRSVKLSRKNATGEETAYENGIPVTYGDTTYSRYQLDSWLVATVDTANRSYLQNKMIFEPSIIGSWSAHNFGFGTHYGWDFKDGIRASTIFEQDVERNHIQGPAVATANGNLEYSSPVEKWLEGDGDDSREVARGTQPSSWPDILTRKKAKEFQTATVTYNYKDMADGAIATAIYKLRMHEPIELISKDRDLITYATDYFKPDGSMLQCFYPNMPGGNHEITDNTSSGWSVTGTLGTEITKYLIPIGVEANYQWTKENAFTQVAPTPVDDEDEEIRPGVGEFMYIRIRHSYNRSHSFFGKYNENGKEKRMWSPTMPCQPDPGVPIEVPHEAIWDDWSADTLEWSAPRPTNMGAPIPTDPQETLPPPSYQYSMKEKNNVDNLG